MGIRLLRTLFRDQMERVVVTRMFPVPRRSRFLSVPRGRLLLLLLLLFISGLVGRRFQADSFVSSSQRIRRVNRRVAGLAEKSIIGSTVPTCTFGYAAVTCSCRFGPNRVCRVLSSRTHLKPIPKKGGLQCGFGNRGMIVLMGKKKESVAR